jgi:Tol biopolymer transport system component
VSTTGEAANGPSCCGSISADGRFVAFQSEATNLGTAGGTSIPGIFLRDVQTGTTTRVEVDGIALSPVISADGRFVAFASGPSNGGDILVWDRITGSLDEVAVHVFFVEDVALSGDGRFVAFSSYAYPPEFNSKGYPVLPLPPRDLSVVDRMSRTQTALTMGGPMDHSVRPSFSVDGRFVAFGSTLDDLVPDDTNGVPDIFVYDSLAGSMELASVGSNGSAAIGGSWPAISPDGRFVAFFSQATNLDGYLMEGTQGVFVRDRAAGTTVKESDGEGESWFGGSLSISGDGRFVAHAGEQGLGIVRDRLLGSSTYLIQTNGGIPGISADGRFVVFDMIGQVVLAACNNPAVCPPPARDSGIQRTPRGDLTLISKPVGTEQWAITFDPATSSVTGNIYFADGRDPAFVACSRTGDDGNLDPYEVAISFLCLGAGPCAGSTCPAPGDYEVDSWSVIAPQVVLPGSFFLPRRSDAAAVETRSRVEGPIARAEQRTDSSPLGTEAGARGSGVQRTPEGDLTLISKRVGAEQWAITFNPADGSVTGNIFFTDGRPPKFVACERVGDDGNPDPYAVAIAFSCQGADECAASSCPAADDWGSIADRVTLPGSFFLPPR